MPCVPSGGRAGGGPGLSPRVRPTPPRDSRELSQPGGGAQGSFSDRPDLGLESQSRSPPWGLLCQGALRVAGESCHHAQRLFLPVRPQFADTPGNLPPSLNLSHLLGLRKNVSILLAYQ